MSDLRIFSNERFGEIRTVAINREPWFIAADVCKTLDISNNRDALSRLDDDEKGVASTYTLGGPQNMAIVSESGLYTLVLSCRKPEAKAFKRWITHDVIPAIRKHGGYIIGEERLNEDELLARALEVAHRKINDVRQRNAALEAKNAVQLQQIAELQPKASYYDVVLNCKDLVAISTIAKDYGWSAQRLNNWLHDRGIQFKQGDIWLLYQQQAQHGYTQTKTHTYLGVDGETHSKPHTHWTQKGRLFIYDLLKEAGFLPAIERNDVS